jgi:ribosomal protein S18 acetylase RimI-like enzyme
VSPADKITPRVAVANLDDALHCNAIIDVLDSYASDPVGGGTPLAPRVRERLVPMLRRQSNTLVLLAFEGSHAIGLAICFFGLSTFAARPLLNVHDIAVVPARRGQGVGRALLTEAERIAVERGCCKLTLEVQDANQTARHLYRRFGFEDMIYGPTRFLEKRIG